MGWDCMFEALGHAKTHRECAFCYYKFTNNRDACCAVHLSSVYSDKICWPEKLSSIRGRAQLAVLIWLCPYCIGIDKECYVSTSNSYTRAKIRYSTYIHTHTQTCFIALKYRSHDVFVDSFKAMLCGCKDFLKVFLSVFIHISPWIWCFETMKNVGVCIYK